jgi:predicted MPP superfamily phosphohydrolase
LEGLRGAAFPTIEHVDLPIDRLPEVFDGFKIAQLTDLHLGVPLTHGAMRRAVAAVEAEQPDLIALTGDYVSFSRHLPLLREALQSLSAPYGLYAIFGNHDHWTHPEVIAQLLRDLGIHLLVNEHRTVRAGDEVLVIAGVDDLWDGHPDLEAALAGVPAGAPVILLAHAPDYADTAALGPVAVQLAGHTHAGHIRLPGLGPLFLPRHGVRYDRGLHRVGQMWLYVCHGLGGWPIRIGSRAEVTVFTLRRVAERAAPGRYKSDT